MESNDSNIIKMWEELQQSSLNDTLKYTVQIFKEENNKPLANASGLLITLSRRFFFVTAAHVFDGKKAIRYIIFPGKLYLYLDEDDIIKTPLPINGIEHDKIDIAVMEISIEDAEKIMKNGFNFLTITDFKLNHNDNGHRYGVVGFIANKTKNISKSLISGSVFQYRSNYEKDFNYSKYGFSATQTIAIYYDGEIVSKRNKNPHLAPKLEGVSGCGLWVIDNIIEKDTYLIASETAKNRKLVGLVIEQNKEAKVLLATRIEIVIRFITQKYGLSKLKKPPLI